jgi:hypothetical protein
MNNLVLERIFIVGCPRSGTTLLQCLLGANSHVATFPETHFFGYVLNLMGIRGALGIASRKALPRWKKLLEELGHPEMKSKLPRLAIFVRQFSNAYVDVLDTLCLAQAKTAWVEKTPNHLHHIDQIQKLVKDAKFVHIIRNSADVVASLYDVTNKYPEMWGGLGWSIDRCIFKYCEDTRLSKAYLSRKNHWLVRYEELVNEPKLVLTKLCKFINVSFEEQMLKDYPISSARVILENEPWKVSTSQPILPTMGNKFYILFDEKQRQYIIERLSENLTES